MKEYNFITLDEPLIIINSDNRISNAVIKNVYFNHTGDILINYTYVRNDEIFNKRCKLSWLDMDTIIKLVEVIDHGQYKLSMRDLKYV